MRDVALSCWITQFSQLRWAFDLEHIAHRLWEYQRIMSPWRKTLPVPVLDVDYEELIADQEGVSRRLVEWLGLEWDPRCLNFHRTERLVRTASVAQVRQPICRGSVARWKHYETMLAPLLARLAEPPAAGSVNKGLTAIWDRRPPTAIQRKYGNLRLDALKMSASAAALGAALVLRPEDAMAANVVLPVVVTAGGAKWTITNNTSGFTGGQGLGILEASLVGPPLKSDGYDGAFVMAVNGRLFQDPSGTVDLTGTTLTSKTKVMSGLTVSEQFFFDPAMPTVRAVYSFTNPSGAAITATIGWGNDLGSDSNTVVVTTSSGDNNIITAADRWIITAPTPPPAPVQDDPTVSFVRFGPGTVQTPSSTASVPGPAMTSLRSTTPWSCLRARPGV